MNTPTTIKPGQRFAHWQVVSLDETGKRATAVCKCGEIRTVNVTDLQSGLSESCGCRPRSVKHHRAIQQAKKQFQLPGWRPERGR